MDAQQKSIPVAFEVKKKKALKKVQRFIAAEMAKANGLELKHAGGPTDEDPPLV